MTSCAKFVLLFFLIPTFTFGVRAGQDSLRVPLEGEFTANTDKAEVNDEVRLTLSITPLEAIERISLRLEIPAGLSLIEGSLEQELTGLKDGESVIIHFAVRTTKTDFFRIVARAVLIDRPDIFVSKAFVVDLNAPEELPCPPREVKNKGGTTYLIFPPDC